ncbi:hypothetical protein DUNSADRAFT_10092 [Dunaliella salina]|uniref:Encoded protein n=1 Tax=Dunaliella salina TaxID=3046 RepID=A0ABQ7GG29_DUNSA|nr:hypothetical protein DUNSADRAFT_10092 [Dunaliella salina]|eukprot:KAF5833560.1 hypothetical protein DUNSADRAFT_10092 [Dunaliella salina]
MHSNPEEERLHLSTLIATSHELRETLQQAAARVAAHRDAAPGLFNGLEARQKHQQALTAVDAAIEQCRFAAAEEGCVPVSEAGKSSTTQSSTPPQAPPFGATGSMVTEVSTSRMESVDRAAGSVSSALNLPPEAKAPVIPDVQTPATASQAAAAAPTSLLPLPEAAEQGPWPRGRGLLQALRAMFRPCTGGFRHPAPSSHSGQEQQTSSSTGAADKQQQTSSSGGRPAAAQPQTSSGTGATWPRQPRAPHPYSLQVSERTQARPESTLRPGGGTAPPLPPLSGGGSATTAQPLPGGALVSERMQARSGSTLSPGQDTVQLLPGGGSVTTVLPLPPLPGGGTATTAQPRPGGGSVLKHTQAISELTLPGEGTVPPPPTSIPTIEPEFSTQLLPSYPADAMHALVCEAVVCKPEHTSKGQTLKQMCQSLEQASTCMCANVKNASCATS